MDYDIAKDAIKDAVELRREQELPDDAGLSEAHKIVVKGRIPITEHLDVQRLIGKQVELQAKYDALLASHKKLVEANKDYKRRVQSHMKGESVKHVCMKCVKDVWYVDDESMNCPFCGEEQKL